MRRLWGGQTNEGAVRETSMKIHQVDVAIVGGGTAGLTAYRAATEHTQSVLLVEGGAWGTTCARVGCMPSKLLLAAAEAAHHSRHAAIFGVRTETRVDGRAVMARVRAERDRFVGFVLRSVEAIPAARKIHAYAHFLETNTLQLSNGERVRAKSVVIATGSRPNHPALLQGAGARLLTSDTLFELPDLPQKVAVFGAGAIGLELAQALHRLGVEIKLFGANGSLGGLRDPAVRNCAEKTLAEEFYLDTRAKVESVRETVDGVMVAFQNAAGQFFEEAFDYALAATGRRANVDKLELAQTGLDLDARGSPVFDPFTLQCGDSAVFIAGDANGDRRLLHEAADEGKIAGHNAALYPNLRAGQRRAVIKIIFSDPQIASVGLNLEQVKLRCAHCYAEGEVSFEDQGRARVMAVNKGLVRVYGEQGSGLFLGAEMVGPRAEHLAHLLSWAVQQRMTVAQMLEMPFYHPVVEEGLRTALRSLSAKLKIGPAAAQDCLECGPGG